MVKPNSLRPFIPDPAQMALAPEISGNTINGLGETDFRRPRAVYWAPDPDDIPHGKMQRWFYGASPENAEINAHRITRQNVLDRPLPDIAKTPTQRDPQDWTDALSRFIASGTCEKIGVAEMQPDWAFEGYSIPQTRVIVTGVHQDYDAMTAAPGTKAAIEVMHQYTRAVTAAKEIAEWLHTQGWAATAITGPMTGALALIPAAIASGFGELGKNGSVINPEMGASFRLSAVLTDAPFAPTSAQDHGVDGFCQNCHICEDACPPVALSPDKKTVRGDTKWYVDFDRCLPFFNQHQGCAICLVVCPWSRPGVGVNLAAKLKRRAQRLAD
jgi:epoxyqueuosine reductase